MLGTGIFKLCHSTIDIATGDHPHCIAIFCDLQTMLIDVYRLLIQLQQGLRILILKIALQKGGNQTQLHRSEERRVGKECRVWWAREKLEKKNMNMSEVKIQKA